MLSHRIPYFCLIRLFFLVFKLRLDIVRSTNVVPTFSQQEEVPKACSFHLQRRVFFVNTSTFIDRADIQSEISPKLLDAKFTVKFDSSAYSFNLRLLCEKFNELDESISWCKEECNQCIQKYLRRSILTRSKLLSEQVFNISNDPPTTIDGNILYSHYFYSSMDLFAEKKIMICVLGSVIVQSLIALLIMNPNNDIVYVSDSEWKLVDANTFGVLQDLQARFNNFHLLKEDALLTLTDCFALHIFNLITNVAELDALIRRFSSSQVQHILWETVGLPFQNNFLYSLDSSIHGFEFDSVAHWYAGEISNQEESAEEFNTAGMEGATETDHMVFRLACSRSTGFGINTAQPTQVYMGSYARNRENITPKEQLRKCFFFITYESNTFIETAAALVDVIRGSVTGCLHHVEVMGSYNRTRYLQLREEYDKENLMQIAIGGHDLHVFIHRYILLHTENSWHDFVRLPHYRHIVRNAAAVLVYSYSHMAYLQRNFGRVDGIFIIPMYSKNIIFPATPPSHNISYMNSSTANDSLLRSYRQHGTIPNDLLCLLSDSRRRQEMRHRLIEQSSRDNVTIILSEQSLFRGTNTIDFADRQTREFLASRSKIFFNFHQFDGSVLETHRVNNLLSLGVCVVSERSVSDPRLDDEYEKDGTVYFRSTFEEMFEMVRTLLSNDTMLRECYRRSLDKYQQLMTQSEALLEAMEFACGQTMIH